MEIFKDFGVEPLLLTAQIVNFVILLYLLKRFLYKPVLKVLEERKQKIEQSLRQAEEIQTTFESITKQKELILQEAKRESSKIIVDAKDEAKTLIEQMLSQTKDSIEDTMKRTQSALELERQKIVAEAKREIIDLVALATEKVVNKSLTANEKNLLVKEALEELEK